MADPRFFKVAGPFTLKELSTLIGAKLSSDADPNASYEDVAPLSTAGPKDISFLDNKKYIGEFHVSQAGACIVEPSVVENIPDGMALLTSPTPYRAYALAAQAFYPEPAFKPSIGTSASIDATAHVPDDCLIEASAVVGPRVVIGSCCRIGANATIDEAVTIGENTSIGTGANLSHCRIGARVHIHPGVCIGQRGFGFAMSASGHVKVPQLGLVIVEDDVEIGANSTIDRGSGPDTVIGAGCMIDNLVQIGHNVRLGRGCVIIAQAGVAGSSELGNFAVLAAQSGISGHLVIGEGAQIAGKTGVMRDVGPGEKVAGIPAVPVKEHFRQVAMLKRLASKKGE
jgi:UDP-3-O-[3-hydroxymyristoyl] glucosamine N-acyltransferase